MILPSSEIVVFKIVMHLVGAWGRLELRLVCTNTSNLLKVRIRLLMGPWLGLVRVLGREDVLFDFLKARHAPLDNL